MASILKVDTIQDQDGNNIINESGDTITIGASGDTIALGSGAILGSGMGKVLQVVQTTTATALTTTSATFVDINLSATITPSSTSSKILILFSTGARNTTGANGTIITIFRGSIASGTNLGDSNWGFGNFDSASDGLLAPFAITHLDSPSTTSAITYTPAGKANAGANLVTSFGNSRGSLVLMEIAG